MWVYQPFKNPKTVPAIPEAFSFSQAAICGARRKKMPMQTVCQTIAGAAWVMKPAIDPMMKNEPIRLVRMDDKPMIKASNMWTSRETTNIGNEINRSSIFRILM